MSARLFVGSLGDAPERAHLHLLHFVRTMTSHFRPTASHIFSARSPSMVGVRLLLGSLTSSRVKFCDSPITRPCVMAFCSLP